MRLHGTRPPDWIEDLAFEYELRFREEPSDAVCAQLARRWAETCDGSGPCWAGRMLFSREYAYLTAQPRWPGSHQRDLFAHVERFLRAVHREVAPLDEVVLLQAMVDLAHLGPGPRHPASQRPVDPTYPAPAPRSACDAVTRAMAETARRERFARWTAEPPPGALGLRALAGPVDGSPGPRVPTPLRTLFPEGAAPAAVWAGATSRPVRIPRSPAMVRREVELTLQGEVRSVPLPDDLAPRGHAAPHPDGTRMAIEAKQGHRGAVVMVDLRDGAVRTLWATAPGELRFGTLGLGWLTGDHLLVATGTRTLVLHAPADGPVTEVCSLPGERTVRSCREGRLVYDVNRGFLGWTGERLVEVTRWRVDYLSLHAETATDLVMRHGKPERLRPEDLYFTVTRLDEVLADLAG